jgi:hypothetical protein
MIYASDKFKKKYSNLPDDFKHEIHRIVENLNSIKEKDQSKYLESLCGENGKALWTGIGKTLFHLYPQGQKSTDRLFYCYVKNLEDELKHNSGLFEGIVFIDYTRKKEEADKAANNYDRYSVKYLSKFMPPAPINIHINLNKPQFWFCLTSDQKSVLNLKQPALVKGSAGTGKTIISFELLKKWIDSDNTKKYLYLTYTKNLLRKAKEALIEDGIEFNSDSIDLIEFSNLREKTKKNEIINEKAARDIISSILSVYSKNNRLPNDILFSDYFIYSYIRGLLKGRILSINKFFLNYEQANMYLTDFLMHSDLNTSEKIKLKRIILDYLDKNEITEKSYNQDIVPSAIILYNSKKDKDKFKEKLPRLFNQDIFIELNRFRLAKAIYKYYSDDLITLELEKDGLAQKNISLLLEIKNRYDEELDKRNLIDDNDFAKYILNQEISDDEKYDGIIVDEVQDLTETQIEALVSLSKNDSDKISFFGDPNQTINPTVYDYGRFNSFVYKKTQNINRKNIKITHRCGPNLLEYINHLVSLRKIFQLTSNPEDLEIEESAITKIDTYWACLVTDKLMIDKVLEEFTRALDCIIIVNDDLIKQKLIRRINNIIDVDHEYLDNQIITVQDSKGLESKNVIIYNIISDNIEIFTNLNTHNKKIATMTFNKLYVSCTRAEDSIIIIEENLEDYTTIKNDYFFINGKPMIENISEDAISDYLSITINPILFLEQAEHAFEDLNFKKSLKKVNISIKNSVEQFKDDEEFIWVKHYIQEDSKLLTTYYLSDASHNYNEFIHEFDILINHTVESNEEVSKVQLLKNRYDCFIKTLDLKKVCLKCIEYEEYEDLMQDDGRFKYIHDLILMKNEIGSMYVANRIQNLDIKDKYLSLVRYIHGYQAYNNKTRVALNSLILDDEIYARILLDMVENDAYKELGTSLKNLKGCL